MPTGAVFNSQTQQFSWTPTSNQAGTYYVTFSVFDGQYQDYELVTITVNDAQSPPVLAPIGNQIVDEGQSLVFTISATDPDGDSLTYSAMNLPTGAVFDTQTQQFSWTPSSDQAGTYYVTFTVSDGQYQDYELVTITVNDAINQATYLLVDDFDDSNYMGWGKVDQGTYFAPSAWSASTGVMIQSSNIYSLPARDEAPKLGTYALYTSGMNWTDYHVSLNIRSDDDDDIGLMFRYANDNNYYRFSWGAQRS